MNVVWIVIDCLRADHVGCYGYPRPTTPNLDRLAAQGLRFETCLSPHIPTQPAHTTMFSGQDVFAHQIVAQGGRQELDPAVRLLPALLRERSFFTGAVDNIGRWFAPAFERYVEYPRWDHDGGQPWRSGEEVTRRALALLDEAAARQPFFLFFHYWDPHTPYLPPPPFNRMFYAGDEKDPRHTSMEPVWAAPWFRNYFSEWLPGVTDREFVRAQYDASIAYADHCLGAVFDRLAAPDLADTLILVLADHGEELDEHGCWFDHHGLYETNVRVPLIIRAPGHGKGEWENGGKGEIGPAPSRFPSPTPPLSHSPIPPFPSLTATLFDLAPTVLHALGLPDLPARHAMPGRPLLELSTLNSQLSTPLYLTECTWMRKRAWRTAEWKLIEALEPDIYGKPPLELYDLAADPGETRSVAAGQPEVVTALQSDMRAWVERRLRETGRPDPLVVQADALRIWQPRFIEGRSA